MATKHEQILAYIGSLPVGTKISVRAVAREQHVSEGTAYRAIKEAETTGLVSTIERVGTIRIEQKPLNNIDSLTFRGLLSLTDAKVLGGSAGLPKHLDKFVIGAMTPDEMLRYITKNSVVIVGNREDAQMLALQNGAAVLITGGFATTDRVIRLGNEMELPVMQTTHDTFTVATMINRALSDQAIKQDILTIAAIYTPLSDDVQTGAPDQTVADFTKLRAGRNDFALPIITPAGRLVGMVGKKQVAGKKPSTLLERVMSKDAITVRPYLGVTAVGHMMQGNGLSVLPVVDDDWHLLGIVTRGAVYSALAELGSSSQGTTIADSVAAAVTPAPSESPQSAAYTLVTTPMMMNKLGTLSFGVTNEIVNYAVTHFLNAEGRRNVLIEQLSLHAFRPIQLEATIHVTVKTLELNSHTAVFEVALSADGMLAALALTTCQLLERTTR